MSSIPALKVLIVLHVTIQATEHMDDTLYPSLGISPSCDIQGASPLFLSLDVLHPKTSSANSTPCTDSSHPTWGRYPSLGVSHFCDLQGAFPLFFSLDVLHPSTLSANSTPSTDSSYPTQRRYAHISFLCYSGRFTKLRYSVLTPHIA